MTLEIEIQGLISFIKTHYEVELSTVIRG